MHKDPFCSIIILNYQGEKLIKATLESLSHLTYPTDRFEVIIVDNASQDQSREVLNKYQMTNDKLQMKLVMLNKNLGFAGGNNEGIRKAKGDYIILLNNDCIVDPNWLTELVKSAEKDTSVFAVSSKVFLGKTNKIQNVGIRMFNDGYGRDIGAVVQGNTQDYATDIGQYNKERELYAACGVAALYRRSMLDTIGLLDDTFFLYYEDVEISERARMHGYKIVYAPKAIVHHSHAASSEEWSPFFIFHSELGRLLHMFFWFPQRIFWREYLKFKFKSLLRIPFGIKHNRLSQQSQYFKVVWHIFWRLPELYKKRTEKLKKIPKNKIEINYQSIIDNKR